MSPRPLWMPPPPPQRVSRGVGWALVVIAVGWGLTLLLWQAGG